MGRSSQAGDQPVEPSGHPPLAGPSSCIVAGTSDMRIRVASSSTATRRPTLNILRSGRSRGRTPPEQDRPATRHFQPRSRPPPRPPPGGQGPPSLRRLACDEEGVRHGHRLITIVGVACFHGEQRARPTTEAPTKGPDPLRLRTERGPAGRREERRIFRAIASSIDRRIPARPSGATDGVWCQRTAAVRAAVIHCRSGGVRRRHCGVPGQVTVIEKVRLAVVSRSSVTRTVKVNVPLAVGVPVMRPGLSSRVSPGGRSPETSAHV